MNRASEVEPSIDPRGERLLTLARLGRPHGVQGEIHARPFAPPILDFASLIRDRPVRLRTPDGRGLDAVRVTAVRPHRGGFLLTIEGIEDRDGAQELRGAELCAPRGELPNLPEGWFWEADLEGCTVFDAERGPIGIAESLGAAAGQWRLGVKTDSGEDVTIPWVKGLIDRVDLEARRIEVTLPRDYPGLA